MPPTGQSPRVISNLSCLDTDPSSWELQYLCRRAPGVLFVRDYYVCADQSIPLCLQIVLTINTPDTTVVRVLIFQSAVPILG